MVRVSSRDDDSTTREKVSVLEDAREMRRRGEEGGVFGFLGCAQNDTQPNVLIE